MNTFLSPKEKNKTSKVSQRLGVESESLGESCFQFSMLFEYLYIIILHNMTVLICISFMSTCLALYLVSKPCSPSNVLVEVHKIHRYTPSHNCVLYLIHIYQSQDCFSYVSESQLTSSTHFLRDPVRLSHRSRVLTTQARSAEFEEE